MHIQLQNSIIKSNASIEITGSKSESNRLLLLQALYPKLTIKNLSNSDDTQLMKKALISQESLIDIHHAGTAMRFLTAFYAIQESREIVLTGSHRMHERPIKILVDALRALGAEIAYEKKEGYPPLRIKGKILNKYKVSLQANVSSQYISALLLMASKLEKGLELTLEGHITSVPYIKMTLALLDKIGVKTTFKNNVITISPTTQEPISKTLTVESDWSSASYYYSCIALSDVGTSLTLSSYKKNSLQGDSSLVDIYKEFGVETVFENNKITITKSSIVNHQSSIKFNLIDSPDIAQTIAITCLGLGVDCHLTGLHTLKIKETDRLEALKTEIEKFGTQVNITKDELMFNKVQPLNHGIQVDTYHDHRMAMAFAPLALKQSLSINDADVVSKSYPDFWKDLNKIGFNII